MAMVCPKCSTSYEQRLQCPLCGARLLFHEGRRGEHPPARPTHWRQRPWGRILVGLMLSQGLFYALRQLLTAVLMATQEQEAIEQLGGKTAAVLSFQIVGGLALLVGTLFTGAGQRQGAFLGCMVGAWNGVLSVLFFRGPAQVMTPIAVLGQPLLQAVVGAVGGWVGSAFWKPIGETWSGDRLPMESEKLGLRKRDAFRPHFSLFAGPVAWFRVSIGVFLAVAGTLTATFFFKKLLDLSHGTLATTDDLQDRLITMEIQALALLLGGVLAGTSTRNGIKQGFCVGLAATVILIGIEIQFVEHWLQMAGLTVVGAFSLSLVGGWFGSQLIPPIARPPRHRALDRALS